MAKPACPAPMTTVVTVLIDSNPRGALNAARDVASLRRWRLHFTSTVTFVGLVTMS